MAAVLGQCTWVRRRQNPGGRISLKSQVQNSKKTDNGFRIQTTLTLTDNNKLRKLPLRSLSRFYIGRFGGLHYSLFGSRGAWIRQETEPSQTDLHSSCSCILLPLRELGGLLFGGWGACILIPQQLFEFEEEVDCQS